MSFSGREVEKRKKATNSEISLQINEEIYERAKKRFEKIDLEKPVWGLKVNKFLTKRTREILDSNIDLFKIKTNPDLMDSERLMAEITALGSLLGELEAEELRLNFRLKEAEALAYLGHVRFCLNNGVKKPKEIIIKHHITLNPEVRKVKDEFFTLVFKRNCVLILLEALKIKEEYYKGRNFYANQKT